MFISKSNSPISPFSKNSGQKANENPSEQQRNSRRSATTRSALENAGQALLNNDRWTLTEKPFWTLQSSPQPHPAEAKPTPKAQAAPTQPTTEKAPQQPERQNPFQTVEITTSPKQDLPKAPKPPQPSDKLPETISLAQIDEDIRSELTLLFPEMAPEDHFTRWKLA